MSLPSTLVTALNSPLADALTDRYRIDRELGHGGMATVYLAEDLKHHRRVAVKVLRAELAAALGPERFLREIELAAGLTHPHILSVHDSGEAAGLLYYVMPYVEGESLRDRLTREHQLPLEDGLQVAREIADALAYAHGHGIVHRDIKPENILFEAGHAVLSDFGIARAISAAGGETLTQTGMAVGTPAYMSPEQAGGEQDLDGRSDLYSLGCVLYEMLAGHPPFLGRSAQEVLARHALDPVPPLRSVRPTVPPAVEQAVTKAMAKIPADRFATAAQFNQALARSIVPTGLPAVPDVGAPPGPSPVVARARRRVAMLGAAGLVLLLLAGLLARGPLRGRHPSSIEPKMLAVLPFDNLGRLEDEYFADGLAEEITGRLASVAGLGVISRTSAMQYKKTTKSLRQVGRELGAGYVLEGSVRWEKAPDGSSRVRITPQLIRVSDDRHLWAGRYDETLDEVFQVQSRVAEQVAAALDVTLNEPERAALAARPTTSLRAYDFYLLGNTYLSQVDVPEELRRAEQMYARAVELDPSFALALAKLARAHIWQFHLSDRTEARLAKAQMAADSALHLQPDLPEAHLALGFIYYWGRLDYGRALEEFRAAQARDPNNSDLAWARGLVERRLGEWEQAIADLRRAVELDPRSMVKTLDLYEVYLRQRNYVEADRYVDRAIALAPDLASPYLYKAILIVARDGDLPAARRTIQEGIRQGGVEKFAFWLPQFEIGAALWAGLDSVAQTALERLSLDAFGTDSAKYFLAKGRALRYRGDTRRSRIYFDSTATVLERRSEALPEDPALHAALGVAYAGLGHRESAVREGKRAVELRPVAEDTWYGVDMLRNLAVIYATLGEAHAAVEQLRILLAIPSWISVAWLRSDPTWDPLRNHPGFQSLLTGVREHRESRR
ncbi:MAG: protein kinase domain-containing protein [Gemmatimonadales bacterium]